MQEPFSTQDQFSRPEFEQLVWDVVHSANPSTIASIKQALWLYLSLLLQAGRRKGTLEFDLAVTAKALGVKDGTVASWLGHLKKAGLIATRKWPGTLLVKLTRFHIVHQHSDVADRPHTRPTPAPAAPRLTAAQEAYAKALAQALQDEENLERYLELVASRDQAKLQQALTQVQKVPAAKIRKSRAALFHYIIKNQPAASQAPRAEG